jgi:hypothetical protein
MAHAEHTRPGEPPEVRDEAADTPLWVPAVGLALLILGAVFLVWQSATERTAAEGETEQVEAEAPAEGDAPSRGEDDEAGAAGAN